MPKAEAALHSKRVCATAESRRHLRRRMRFGQHPATVRLAVGQVWCYKGRRPGVKTDDRAGENGDFMFPKTIIGEVCLGLLVAHLLGIGGLLLAGYVARLFN